MQNTQIFLFGAHSHPITPQVGNISPVLQRATLRLSDLTAGNARAKVKVCTMICWALSSASGTKSLEVHGKHLLLSLFHNKP